jgi:TolB-like protein/DNA-binding winged helix-turn-helix (wHTH) protein/cytochrome c-type biogenesis protein CcmH/NrfG
MNDGDGHPRLWRFGVFEVDLRRAELRKQGLKVKLHGQPFEILAMLLERPGEPVTREEIREKLWPEETFVDFEHSINTAVNRLREALGDDAERPRYIETLPRRGYRFLGPVEAVAPAPSPEVSVTAAAPPSREAPAPGKTGVSAKRRNWWRLAMAGVGLVAVVAALFALNVAGLRDRLLTAVGARRGPPLPKIESIAVLPLVNLSGDAEQEYFADGMTEELITNLGKISALRVISRTSVMHYKGTKKPLPEIARELNVDAIVEGTVRRSGNRVRVTANLLDANADRHLWAESYERDLGDVLTLQSALAQAVAREIKVAISPAESSRLAAVRSVKPEAYELYLKGRYHYYKWNPDDFRKALDYFQKAIEADPDWAPAYAGVATTCGWLWIAGALRPQEALPRFSAALKTALAIDDADPEVRYALAASAFYYRWDWEEADREFQRALALDPNLVEARFEYGWFLVSMGRFSAAVGEAQRAVERDPLSVSANLALGDVYFWAHQDDQAIAQLRRTAELEPDDYRAHEFLTGMYQQKQMYAEALAELQKVVALHGAPPEKLAGLQHAYQQSGPQGYWMWQLSDAKRRSAPYEIALDYARLGDAGRAVAWLERAYQQHDWHMIQLKTLRAWEPVRSDPRFQNLLRRMNFPP